jgi:hypothetical protein
VSSLSSIQVPSHQELRVCLFMDFRNLDGMLRMLILLRHRLGVLLCVRIDEREIDLRNKD